MKMIDKNFKTKNLRNIILSVTVGIIPCIFLCFLNTFLYGLAYLYIAFPIFVIFFGGKTKKLKKQNLFIIAGKSYKHRQLEIALFCTSVCIVGGLFGIIANSVGVASFLPKGFIYCLPFLTYHVFCTLFSHPLSLLKGFGLLKGRGGYAPYTPHFPSSESFQSTGFGDHSVNYSSYDFSSSSETAFDNYFNHPGSPGYRNK